MSHSLIFCLAFMTCKLLTEFNLNFKYSNDVYAMHFNIIIALISVNLKFKPCVSVLMMNINAASNFQLSSLVNFKVSFLRKEKNRKGGHSNCFPFFVLIASTH